MSGYSKTGMKAGLSEEKQGVRETITVTYCYSLHNTDPGSGNDIALQIRP
jgi:hypothetical protein